jgi:DNA polymerase-3 subunit epsilon
MHFPKGHFVFLDLETTGSRAGFDRITEVGLIEVLDGEVIDQFQTLLNPQAPISGFITSLTGIDDRMVANAPLFSDIAEDRWPGSWGGCWSRTMRALITVS